MSRKRKIGLQRSRQVACPLTRGVAQQGIRAMTLDGGDGRELPRIGERTSNCGDARSIVTLRELGRLLGKTS
jgi:hypothetical protein